MDLSVRGEGNTPPDDSVEKPIAEDLEMSVDGPDPLPGIVEENLSPSLPAIAEENGPSSLPAIAEENGRDSLPVIGEKNGPDPLPAIAKEKKNNELTPSFPLIAEDTINEPVPPALCNEDIDFQKLLNSYEVVSPQDVNQDNDPVKELFGQFAKEFDF